jgi:peptide-methionine (R)-S-oxide reductase
MTTKSFPVQKTDDEWRKALTPEQFYVLRQHGTERPGTCALLHEKRTGTFTCAGCGQPLFVADRKFESGTGWPSFTKPIAPDRVVEKVDHSFGVRAEIRSKSSDSHLGHVFDDGPPPIGLRYCMNSAALRFVPVEELKEKGLAQYLSLFDAKK